MGDVFFPPDCDDPLLLSNSCNKLTEVFFNATEMIKKINKSVDSLESKVGTLFEMVDAHFMTQEHSKEQILTMKDNFDLVENCLGTIDENIKKIPIEVKSILKQNWDHGIKFVETTSPAVCPAVCEPRPDPGNLLKKLDHSVMVPCFHVSIFWKCFLKKTILLKKDCFEIFSFLFVFITE